MKTAWTVDLVKEKLPDVPVIVFGSVQNAKLSGRLNQFASVSIPGICKQYSWQTITNILNAGKPLDFDVPYPERLEIKMPKNKQEGLANAVAMILNQLRLGNLYEVEMQLVNLLDDVSAKSNPYRIEAGKKRQQKKQYHCREN